MQNLNENSAQLCREKTALTAKKAGTAAIIDKWRPGRRYNWRLELWTNFNNVKPRVMACTYYLFVKMTTELCFVDEYKLYLFKARMNRHFLAKARMLHLGPHHRITSVDEIEVKFSTNTKKNVSRTKRDKWIVNPRW